MKSSISLLQCIMALFLTLSVTVTSAQEVELLKADSRIHGKYGFTWQTYTMDILVDNLAYEKKVSISYLDDDGQWKELEASFSHMVSPEKEVWQLSRTRMLHHPNEPAQQPLNLIFRIKYEADGNVYLDDNQQRNYFISAGSGEYIRPTILVDYAGAVAPYDTNYGDNNTHFDGRFSVGVLLKNLGYTKDVKVHYTTDDWETTHISNLSFQHGRMLGYSWITYPNPHGVEYWSMTTTGPEMQDISVDQIEFVISYEVNGQTYWDNNFGQNYQVSVLHH
ncbi:carbohydrate-binding protein [Hahella ganghwensis]|uniref:carbohydrate-binding protein n=1 Tax=Hahella ganghwensis TaxID=286420 RepID=UPI000382AB23|nr:carbohydrate-binding protein [Hahella ganghwensis]